MTVPDRICGLKMTPYQFAGSTPVSFRTYTTFGDWRICLGADMTPTAYYARPDDECESRLACGTVPEVIAAVEASIRSVAAECRAFADKVLGER